MDPRAKLQQLMAAYSGQMRKPAVMPGNLPVMPNLNDRVRQLMPVMKPNRPPMVPPMVADGARDAALRNEMTKQREAEMMRARGARPGMTPPAAGQPSAQRDMDAMLKRRRMA